MAGTGGARPGAGRKTKAEEMKSSLLAVEAITERHGDLKTGLKWLLDSGEAGLVKFVFEHAFGKPTEAVEIFTPNGIQVSEHKVIFEKYDSAPTEQPGD